MKATDRQDAVERLRYAGRERFARDHAREQARNEVIACMEDTSKLSDEKVVRWREEAVTAPDTERLWLQRCEVLCNALRQSEKRYELAEGVAREFGWHTQTCPAHEGAAECRCGFTEDCKRLGIA